MLQFLLIVICLIVYSQAASTLKNAEGLLSIVVAKPHRVSNRSDQGSTAQLNQGDSESAQNDQKKDQSKLIISLPLITTIKMTLGQLNWDLT